MLSKFVDPIISLKNNFSCITILLLKFFQNIIVFEMSILQGYLFWQDLMAPSSHNNTRQGCKTCENWSFVSRKNHPFLLANLQFFMNDNLKNNILMSENIRQKRLKILEYLDAYIRLIMITNTCIIQCSLQIVFLYNCQSERIQEDWWLFSKTHISDTKWMIFHFI